MKQVMRSVTVFLLMMGFSSLAIAEEATPKQVVASTIESIIAVLEARDDKTKVNDNDREGIRKVVKGKFDYREMSRRSVGKPWREMDESKKVEFTELFRQVLEFSYGNQLAGYKCQKVVFEDA